VILNTTKKPRERYRIIPGSMGNADDPPDSPNHYYYIVMGINRGKGYQSCMSVSHFLNGYEDVPEEAKRKCRNFLIARGFKV
jgi:hypothetical protein